MRDDQRERATNWDESPLAVIHHLLDRPPPDWPTAVPVQHVAAFVETTSYVGPVVVLLVLASLARGWRWWHTLTLIAACFALGSMRWYHPSYWTSELAALRLDPRGDPLAVRRRCWASAWRPGACSPAGVVSRAARPALRLPCSPWPSPSTSSCSRHQQLPLAFSLRPEPQLFPGPPVPDIVNVRRRHGLPVRHEGLRRDPRVRAHAGRIPARRPHAPAGPGGPGLSRRGLDGSRDGPAGLLEPEPDRLPRRARAGGLHSTRTPARGGGSTAGRRSPDAGAPSRSCRSSSVPTKRVGSTCGFIPVGWDWGSACTSSGSCCWPPPGWRGRKVP